MPFTQQTDSPTFLSGVADALGFNSGERESGPETIAKWAQGADKWLDEEAPWWLNALSYAVPVFGTYRGATDIMDNANDGDSSNDLAMAGDVALMLASLIPGAGGIYSGLTKGALKAGSKIAKGAKGVKVAGKEGEAAAKALKNSKYLPEEQGPALSEIMERLGNGDDLLAGPRAGLRNRLSKETGAYTEADKALKDSIKADKAAAEELRAAEESLGNLRAAPSPAEAYANAYRDADAARQLAVSQADDIYREAEKTARGLYEGRHAAQGKHAKPRGQHEQPEISDMEQALEDAKAARATRYSKADEVFNNARAKAETARSEGEKAITDAEARLGEARRASDLRGPRDGNPALTPTEDLRRIAEKREGLLAETYRKAQKSQEIRELLIKALLTDRTGSGILGRSIRQLPYGAAYASLNPYFMGDEYTPYKAWQSSAGQGR